MIVFFLLSEDIDFGMNALFGVSAKLDFTGSNIVHKLEHAFFYISAVSRFLDVFPNKSLEVGANIFGNKTDAATFVVIFSGQRIHVYAYKDAHAAHLAYHITYLIVARCAEIAYQRIEMVDVQMPNDALELGQQRIGALVGEKFGY